MTMSWSEETSECLLTIDNATQADEGAYRFDAINENGSMSITVMVTLRPEGAPLFEIPPEPVVCYTGDTIRLATRVLGRLDFHYLHVAPFDLTSCSPCLYITWKYVNFISMIVLKPQDETQHL